ncbi:unnamed protein product [Anisakis simplex]|uniref:Uncharacterized protein n=1 Tax=Anisakis simplex TaxID=6269 RepID=A0A0M3JZ00_ANISI|nr:unnamed protein product [Anisakis simplex]
MVRTELLRCGCLIITSPMHDATTNSLLSVNTQSNPTVVLNPTFDFTASTPIPEEEDDDQSDRIQLICDDQDDDIPTSSTPCQNVSCASDTPETTRLR